MKDKLKEGKKNQIKDRDSPPESQAKRHVSWEPLVPSSQLKEALYINPLATRHYSLHPQVRNNKSRLVCAAS
jgi:hypothetical protein